MVSNLGIGGCDAALQYRHPLLSELSFYTRSLCDFPDPKAKRSVRWTPLAAATAAILMAFDAGRALGVRCAQGLACLDIDFTCARRVGRTYTGLQKALERQAPRVPVLLKHSLRTHVLEQLSSLRRQDRWIVLAVDGSKQELPRTKSNEKEFGLSDNGVVPQAFETVIVDVYTGLLWDWRLGRGKESEKKHLEAMIPSLPEGTLLLADANFGGYPIWSALCKQGCDFLIRVGGNASLLKDLFPATGIERRGDIVYAWPKIKQEDAPPLRLRLIRVGKRSNPVYLITNVLDQSKLSKHEAGSIYRKRWGVELFYRTFKRTMGYAKLACRAGRRATLELSWGLLAASVAILIGIGSLRARRKDPRQLSHAKLLKALRTCLRGGTVERQQPAPLAGSESPLAKLLCLAVRDAYIRHTTKASRYTRITKNTPKPLKLKPPKVRNATDTERRAAATYTTLVA